MIELMIDFQGYLQKFDFLVQRKRSRSSEGLDVSLFDFNMKWLALMIEVLCKFRFQ